MQEISEIQVFDCKCTTEECREIQKKANNLFKVLNDNESLKKRATLFRALGNQVRLNILGLLAVREMCICEIVEAIEAANSTIAHHLRLLTEGGLVESRRDGKFTIYRLNNELIKKHKVLEESDICC
jgi:DNA-binding transcriptional ArsR family regulator